MKTVFSLLLIIVLASLTTSAELPLSPVCWPLNFAGITLGVTADSEVQRLLGNGVFRKSEGDGQRQFNIGYNLNFDFHGQGYVSEACRAVLRRAIDRLQADRVVTGTAALNHASCRLLERLGFQKVGEETASFRTAEDGKSIEFLGYRYAISRDEWENRKT